MSDTARWSTNTGENSYKHCVSTCTSCSYQSGGVSPFDMRQTWKRQIYISAMSISWWQKSNLLYVDTVTVTLVHLIMAKHCTAWCTLCTLCQWCNKIGSQWCGFQDRPSRNGVQNIKPTQMKLERGESKQKMQTTEIPMLLQFQSEHHPSRTIFISMPLVYVQACWKYSSSLCLSGFGIWWKRMNSLTRSIWRWYLAVPEYNLWMMADTFPKMLAYIRAGREAIKVTVEYRWVSFFMYIAPTSSVADTARNA